MLDTLLRPPGPNLVRLDLDLASALEYAAASIARLDQALNGHPLLPAFLYRSRLEAVRRQAAVDGQAIDPWHLAAVLEGLRLRMDQALGIIDRGQIFEAANHAFKLHQWLTAPDFDQEGDIQQATRCLGSGSGGRSPLLAAARSIHAWLDQGGGRAPMRAALVRHWTATKLLRAPVPLTGPKALRADTPWDEGAWVAAFLTALADEALDHLQLLFGMDHAWRIARRTGAGERRTSRSTLAIDIMAAAPLVSASSLAAGLSMAVNNASALLERFCADGIAVEVTHRSKRRLFGLAGLAPLRDGTAPPRRPEPGRGRGRPTSCRDRVPEMVIAPPVEPSFARISRADFDYSDLSRWMAHADHVIRQTQLTLAAASQPEPIATL